MIFDAIFDLLFGVIEFVLGLLPSWDPPEFSLGAAARELGGAVHVLDGWLPLSLMADVMTLMIAVWGATLTAKFVLWLYHMLPGKGT